MIKTNELKGLIVANGFTQQDIANKLGITPKTFYSRMARGVFDSNQIQIMINLLKIEDPAHIFFDKQVTWEAIINT